MGLRYTAHRHLAQIYQNPERRWEWWALEYGWAQPKRFALGPPGGGWMHRPFRFHLTPIHIERWAGSLEIGLCLGKRTLMLRRHR